MTAVLSPELRELLEAFELHPSQKTLVWECFQESPEGVAAVAWRARSRGTRDGSTGAGLLVSMLQAGDHLKTASRSTRPLTGWRFARGTHSGTYVRDPYGTDPLPEGYN